MFKSNYEDLTGRVFGDLKVISQAKSNFSKRKESNKLREERKWNCRCVCGNEYIAFESRLKNGKTQDCGCKIHRDRIGLKFGKLTIVEYIYVKNRTKYKCKCECGNETTVFFNELTSGRTVSCGCSKNTYKNSETHDLTGLKFGRLTVLNFSKVGRAGNRLWNCKCDCGNVVEVEGTRLDTGVTKSCGCLVVDLTVERSRKYNTYEYKEDYVIIKDDKGNEILLDIDDFNKYNYKDKWVTLTITGGYPCYKKNDKYVLIHREIMGLDEYDGKTVVDHINRNRVDDRKSNLRITNITGNARNSGLQINNKSGVIGVKWHKRDKKWYVTIGINGGNKHLGSFCDMDIAIKTRLKAELDYYGKDFAPQRDLFEKYNID